MVHEREHRVNVSASFRFQLVAFGTRVDGIVFGAKVLAIVIRPKTSGKNVFRDELPLEGTERICLSSSQATGIACLRVQY
jgi:hypothetical protein